MNERIQELILEAGIIHYEEGGDLLETFAELILRECLDILDDEDDCDADGRSVRIAAIRIKKLFGVEE